ncbi:MAG: hypothetical protein K0S99_3347, partial [Thermomicrobiales bacterium]|nr:hypothetical protein [Thermomicrobiales bacterium]
MRWQGVHLLALSLGMSIGVVSPGSIRAQSTPVVEARTGPHDVILATT